MIFKTDLITLSHVETFHYYDFPRLFSARDEQGNLYLVNNIDLRELGDLNYIDDFLAVPVSEDRLKQIAAGEIDLHDAFRLAEGGRGIWFEHPWGEESPNKHVETAREVILAELEEDLFVKPGVTLKE